MAKQTQLPPSANVTTDQLAELEALRAENARLKANAQRKVTLKAAKKGGVSLYGLGRFPITQYKSTWVTILDMADEIRAFIKDNEDVLSTGKDDPRFQNVGD